MASSSRPAPEPERVLALFGPTASGKTAVAGALRERLGAEVISADSAALYEGLPILTAAPPYPAHLVGIVPLDREVSVGEFQQLAHRSRRLRRAPARRGRHRPLLSRRARLARAAAAACPRAPRLLAGGGRPARRRGRARAARRAGRRGGRPRARERPSPRRPGARARRGRIVARAPLRHALDRRHSAADAGRRPRGRSRRARPAHRGPSPGDGRGRCRGRGAPRLGGAALGNGAQGARPPGVRDAAGGRRDRRRRPRDAQARPVSAKMAAPHARRRHAGRKPACRGDRR